MKKNLSRYMLKAIRLSEKNIMYDREPFGAVIVKDTKIVAEGQHCVLHNIDCTAHAEMIALRRACKKLHTTTLTGCEIYVSSQPCPMCLAAIFLAGIRKVYYAASLLDIAAIGFDHTIVYEELMLENGYKQVECHQMHRDLALNAFRMWHSKQNRNKENNQIE